MSKVPVSDGPITAYPKKPLLICMLGLPRSGKTTIVRELMKKHQAPVVRRDDIRLALHGKRYEGKAEPFVKAISDVMIRSLFLSGHEVVICDETNYSRAARDYHKSSDWDTVFYEVPTSPEVCKERALATEQPDLVPVIQQMWERREPLGPDEKRYAELEWMENATRCEHCGPVDVAYRHGGTAWCAQCLKLVRAEEGLD